jgi:hypothetical protein
MQKSIIFFLYLVIISTAVFSQNGYTVIKTKLPMSSTEKQYYVKKVGQHYVLNGDIIIGNAGQSLMMYQSNSTDGNYIWPKGYVPVKIDKSMQKNKSLGGNVLYENALQAIKELNAKTNLRLVPYTNQKDYIRIMYTTDTGYGGISPIGRRGGEQIIYITRESTITTIVHELLHSLGFWHEQSRYDRDNYVVIDTSNVKVEQRHNFQIEPGTTTSAYDYNSIMHYPAFAFAINQSKRTIRCKNSKTLAAENCNLGGTDLTNQDIAGINTSYFYNIDVARRDYAAELPFDEYLPTAKRVQEKPVLIDANSKATKIVDVPLADGIYMIKIGSTSRYLTIADKSMVNGALLQQWDKVGSDNQKFAVTKSADGYYLFKVMHSGKYLNVTGQSIEERATINQWEYVDQPNLKFYLRYYPAKKGYYIQGLQSNLYWFLLDDINGENIVQTPRISDYFIFERTGDIPIDKKGIEKMLLRREGIENLQAV